MAIDLNSLGGAPLDAPEIDYENLPSQGGGFAPLLPPGPYRFELPVLTTANFDPIPAKPGGDIKTDRVKVKFDKDAPLKIVQAASNPQAIGEPYTATITNMEMSRGKKGDLNAPKVSDWDYLNAALGEPGRPKTNREYIEKLIARSTQHAQFSADQEWSWKRDDKRDAYFANESGSAPVEDPENAGSNKKGCGKKYYQGGQNGIAKVDGVYPERIECECGALVRAFGNLRNFRK